MHTHPSIHRDAALPICLCASVQPICKLRRLAALIPATRFTGRRHIHYLLTHPLQVFEHSKTRSAHYHKSPRQTKTSCRSESISISFCPKYQRYSNWPNHIYILIRNTLAQTAEGCRNEQNVCASVCVWAKGTGALFASA